MGIKLVGAYCRNKATLFSRTSGLINSNPLEKLVCVSFLI